MTTALRRIALLAVVLILAACGAARSGTDTADTVDGFPRSSVTITNQSWLQVVMYVNRGGQRIRLGDVQSQATQTFRLPAGVQSGPIRFIADPVGGRQTAQSWDMTLAFGEDISLTIPATAFR